MKYTITPQMDEMIKNVYRTMTGNGEVKALANKLRLPRWKVTRRAMNLGLITKKQKDLPWSDMEIRILEKWAHITPEKIALKLKDHGYNRTCTAIVLKRKRLRLLSNLVGMSASMIAEMFGVDVKVITRWIEKGYLKAERRGTSRTEVQGGDMWWIKEEDIRKFIIKNIDIIDIRKVDKHWFVDILVNGPIMK